MAKVKLPFYHRPIGELGIDMLSGTVKGVGWTLRSGYGAGAYVLEGLYYMASDVVGAARSKGATIAKVGLLTAVGVGAAFYLNQGELTKPSPYDITGVAEKKICDNNFVILKSRNGSLTDMIEEKGVLRNLDDIEKEKLKEIDEESNSERETVIDKYKTMGVN